MYQDSFEPKYNYHLKPEYPVSTSCQPFVNSTPTLNLENGYFTSFYSHSPVFEFKQDLTTQEPVANQCQGIQSISEQNVSLYCQCAQCDHSMCFSLDSTSSSEDQNDIPISPTLDCIPGVISQSSRSNSHQSSPTQDSPETYSAQSTPHSGYSSHSSQYEYCIQATDRQYLSNMLPFQGGNSPFDDHKMRHRSTDESANYNLLLQMQPQGTEHSWLYCPTPILHDICQKNHHHHHHHHINSSDNDDMISISFNNGLYEYRQTYVPPMSSSLFTPGLHAPLHQTHMENNARPYQCHDCHRAFARKHDLQRHSRVHTGLKPYSCAGCKKAFARTDALKRHLRMEDVCRMSPEVKALMDSGKRRYKNLI